MATMFGFINVSIDQSTLESMIRVGLVKHFNEQMDLDLPDATIDEMGTAYAKKVTEQVEIGASKLDRALWEIVSQGKAPDLNFSTFINLLAQLTKTEESSKPRFDTVEDLFSAPRREK